MAVAPKFNASIDADISKFMRKLEAVDRTIREAASGAIVNIGADIRDFVSNATTVQSTIADINRDNSTININANASNFNRVARDVENQTSKLSRKVTEARIGANIGSFENKMVDVMRALTDANDTVTPEIKADITEFTREITTVQSRMREIARSTANPQVEADIAGFMAQIALVEAELNSVIQLHDVEIDADISGFRRGAAIVKAQVLAFSMERVVIPIRTAFTNYKNTMGQIANFSRSVSEVMAITGRGLMISLAPAIVPVLSSVVGLIGNLGPMIGTVAGSTFALATSFGAAGLGAAGFAAVAIPSIGKVIKTSTELKELEEKIAKADTWKERNKLMKEQSEILNGMSKAQAKAGEALNAFKSDYSALVKDMETPVLNIFASALTGITGVLDLARPMIENVTTSVQNLVDSFNANLEAADVKAFFGFLKDYAGPALETIGKAVGNFTMGLFNMMEAFGPLSTETQNGFLKMSESFRSWSAALSENEKFQTFVAYVSENMPKIRSIFGDAIKGIINTFAAFGESSSGMMTKVQGMMESFVSWSAALGESQGFKNFIDYIQTNGPVVASTIGNIVTFIINLGIAMAPLGEKIVALVNSFLQWTNGMLEAHPWLGKIAAGALVLTGGLMAMAPAFLLANSLFGGLILKMALASAKMVATSALFVAKWAFMGAQALIQGARMAAAWVLAMGPVGWVIAAVVGLAILIIANWDKISDWTQKTWSKVSNWISTKWEEAKTATATKIASMVATTSAKFAEISTKVKTKMAEAKTALSNKWEEAKSATTSKLATLVASVATFFAKVVSKVREKMTEAVNKVKEKVGEMPGKVTGFVGQMLSAGADLIQGLIDGALGMASNAISTIKSIAGDMVDAALSFFKIKSPSRVFMEMGAYVSEGLAVGVQDKAKLAVANVARMASDMSNAFNPQMELANMTASASLDTSVSRADMGVVRKSFAAEIDSGDDAGQPVINVYNEWDGDKVVARVERTTAKKSRLTDGFYGK